MKVKINTPLRQIEISPLYSDASVTDYCRTETPSAPKIAAEEKQMMRRLCPKLGMEKAGVKGDSLVQIGGIKREKGQVNG